MDDTQLYISALGCAIDAVEVLTQYLDAGLGGTGSS